MSPQSWVEYERNLLLAGKWLPVTGCVLFVRASAPTIADLLVNGGRGKYVEKLYGHPLIQRAVTAPSLGGLLETLLPLATPDPRRNLLLPTANPAWTAMFDSSRRPPDLQSQMAWFAVAGIESLSITDFPNSWNTQAQRGWSGVRKIEAYEVVPDGQEIGYSLGVRLTDSDRWELVRPHAPFYGGAVWDSTARRVPDKFTHQHLVDTAALHGLHPFEESFYAPEGHGIIIERTDPIEPGTPSYTLAQARGEEPID